MQVMLKDLIKNHSHQLTQLSQKLVALDANLPDVLVDGKKLLSPEEFSERKKAVQACIARVENLCTVLTKQQEPLQLEDKFIPELSSLMPGEKEVILGLIDHTTLFCESVLAEVERVRIWQNAALTKKQNFFNVFRLSSLRRMLQNITQADKVLAFDADRLFKQLEKFVVVDFVYKPSSQKLSLTNLAYKSLKKTLEDAELNEILRGRIEAMKEEIKNLHLEKNRLDLGINDLNFDNECIIDERDIEQGALQDYQAYCANELEILSGLNEVQKNIAVLKDAMLLPSPNVPVAKIVTPKLTRPLLELSKKIQKKIQKKQLGPYS